MTDYVYVCWFRDHTVVPEDQDYEWPACILITADSGWAALSWGDQLATRYCRNRKSCEFLRSYIDPDQYTEGTLPRIAAGQVASDEDIGW